MKVIPVKGAIIPNNNKRWYDAYKIEATAPQDIVLPESGEDVEVHINSGGGSVFAGSEIYTALMAYPGKVKVKVVGLAASAASVIAMAGDEIEMSPTAQMMIHNVSSSAWGDHNALHHEADVIENMNKSIANAYVLKTGKSMDDLLALMDKTTWFTAQDAVDAGFADKVMFQENMVPEFTANVSTVLPQAVIDDLMANEAKQASPDNQMAQVLERLDALEANVIKSTSGDMTVNLDSGVIEVAVQNALKNVIDDSPKAKSPFGIFC